MSCSSTIKPELASQGQQVSIYFTKNGSAFFLLSLNGKKYLAAFDTGFAGSVGINRKIKQELGLSYGTDEVQAVRMWGEGGGSVRTCIVDQLSLSPEIQLSNITAWEVPNLEFMVLGLGVLTNYHILADLAHSNMTLYPYGTSVSDLNMDKSQLRSMDFDLKNLMWLACSEKDLGDFVLMLDSGLSFKDKKNDYYYNALSVNSPKIRQLLTDQEILRAQQLFQSIKGIATYSTEPLFMSTSNLIAGGLSLGPQVFVAAPLHESFHEGALGLGFFMKDKVFIDFKQEKIYFLK